MSTGLPLIVKIAGEIVVYSFCHGENGFVVGVEDITACADAIVKLYDSKELRYVFANENRRLIQAYSLENVIRDMNQIYSEYSLEMQPSK